MNTLMTAIIVVNMETTIMRTVLWEVGKFKAPDSKDQQSTSSTFFVNGKGQISEYRKHFSYLAKIECIEWNIENWSLPYRNFTFSEQDNGVIYILTF